MQTLPVSILKYTLSCYLKKKGGGHNIDKTNIPIVFLFEQYDLLKNNPNVSLDLNYVRKILLQKHKWSNEDPITPEDECVLTILYSLGGTIPTTSILSVLRILQQAGWLNGEDAKANFMAITQYEGRYANDIRSALMYLNEAGLLTGEDAQANFKAITEDGGRYALYNACIRRQSQKTGALIDENPQANFMAIIKDFKKYGKDISAAFSTLQTARLLTEATFKEITVYSGEYARSIAWGLRELQEVGLLSGEHAPAIREAIFIDDGAFAEDFAELFSELQEAGLLTGQHAEANLKTIIKNFRLHVL